MAICHVNPFDLAAILDFWIFKNIHSLHPKQRQATKTRRLGLTGSASSCLHFCVVLSWWCWFIHAQSQVCWILAARHEGDLSDENLILGGLTIWMFSQSSNLRNAVGGWDHFPWVCVLFVLSLSNIGTKIVTQCAASTTHGKYTSCQEIQVDKYMIQRFFESSSSFSIHI